jgi:hypothetical protein
VCADVEKCRDFPHQGLRRHAPLCGDRLHDRQRRGILGPLVERGSRGRVNRQADCRDSRWHGAQAGGSFSVVAGELCGGGARGWYYPRMGPIRDGRGNGRAHQGL